MPTAPAEPPPSATEGRRVPWGVLLLTLLLAAVLLARCGVLGGDDEAPRRPSATTFAAEDALGDVLTLRARALQAGDRDAWLAAVGDEPAYLRQQTWVFDNLAQLPLRVARWELVAGSSRVEGAEVVADVRRELQLDGWDAVPVVTVAAYRFRLTATADGQRYRLVGDAEASAAWDRAPVTVLRDGGALVVTDVGDERAATLPAEVAAAIDAVAAEVPFPWARTAMVLAVDDVGVLAAVGGEHAADPALVDALAFPVFSDPDGGGDVAALRVVLHPRVLGPDVGVEARDRLLRHELTHVALGARDDRVPVWLSEGVAEHVAARSMPRSQRVISRAAVDAARAGAGLPGDADFAGARSTTAYGLAWYACEHVAATYGDDALWDLLETYAAAPDEERDSVLRRTLGLDEAQLGRAASDGVVATFG